MTNNTQDEIKEVKERIRKSLKLQEDLLKELSEINRKLEASSLAQEEEDIDKVKKAIQDN